MKNLTFLVFALLFTQLTAISQPCLPGGIIFYTQASIDNFQTNYPNCTEIEGDVEINGDDISNLNGLNVLTSIEGNLLIGTDTDAFANPNLSSLEGLGNLTYVGDSVIIGGNEVLASLSGLESLTSIEGSLSIGYVVDEGWPPFVAGNPFLSNLSGLNNLTSIGGDLTIIGNDTLTSLSGLENLTSIEGSLNMGVIIWGGPYSDTQTIGNPSLLSLNALDNIISIEGDLVILNSGTLTSLTGLNNVTSIGGDIFLADNEALTSLTGLENITSIEGALYIGKYGVLCCGGNHSLLSLTGLDNVTFIGGGFEVYDNNALTSLTGLNNVTSIGGDLVIAYNPALTSLMGLDNIDVASIDGLHIRDNSSLSTCEVQSVCDYLASPTGTIEIHDNATGCNSQEEVEEACDEVSTKEIFFDNIFTISPNPIGTTTIIAYTIKHSSPVTLKILDLSGRQVVFLVNEYQQQGEQKIEFNTNSLPAGRQGLPAGIYFCVLKTKERIQTEKIIIL